MRIIETYEQWMARVDGIVQALVGCSVHDLPDCCYADWHEAGVSARSAARRAIRAARAEGSVA